MSKYHRILHYIFALFPQAKGEDLPTRITKSLYEDWFSFPEDKKPSSPSLKWYDRIKQALIYADDRVVRNISKDKSDSSLIYRRKTIYSVTDPAGSNELPVINYDLHPHFGNKSLDHRHVPLTLQESEKVEALLRNQTQGFRSPFRLH